jgi:transcriptional regulator GlxA family with amidase domain
MTRRDMCYFIGKRAGLLSTRDAAVAWRNLARVVEGFGEKDVPKFIDLLMAIRRATIAGKRNHADPARA